MLHKRPWESWWGVAGHPGPWTRSGEVPIPDISLPSQASNRGFPSSTWAQWRLPDDHHGRSRTIPFRSRCLYHKITYRWRLRDKSKNYKIELQFIYSSLGIGLHKVGSRHSTSRDSYRRTHGIILAIGWQYILIRGFLQKSLKIKIDNSLKFFFQYEFALKSCRKWWRLKFQCHWNFY